MLNGTQLPFRRFFASTTRSTYTVAPDCLIGEPRTVSVGGVEFGLYPVTGGETCDGLLVHLPELGVVFVGDVFMPTRMIANCKTCADRLCSGCANGTSS
jgi:hypothetical protein